MSFLNDYCVLKDLPGRRTVDKYLSNCRMGVSALKWRLVDPGSRKKVLSASRNEPWLCKQTSVRSLTE